MSCSGCGWASSRGSPWSCLVVGHDNTLRSYVVGGSVRKGKERVKWNTECGVKILPGSLPYVG